MRGGSPGEIPGDDDPVGCVPASQRGRLGEQTGFDHVRVLHLDVGQHEDVPGAQV